MKRDSKEVAGRGVSPAVFTTLVLAGALACFALWTSQSAEESPQASAPAVDTGRGMGIAAATQPASPRQPATVAKTEQPAPLASSEEPPNSSTFCTFLVVSTASQPISGATVVLVDTAWALVARGTTDERGEWRADNAAAVSGRPLAVMASANGFGRQRADLPNPLPVRYEVRLEPTASISGWVMLADSRPAPAGTRVFAWETLTAPSAVAFRRGEQDGAGVATCSVEEDGRFVLEGLSPSHRYTMGAGRSGWTTPELAVDVTPGSGQVRLELWRLYGTVVRASFSNGQLPPPSQLGSLYSDVPKEAPWIALDYPSVQLSLAGIHEVAGVRRHGLLYDWRNYLAVYVASHEVDELHGMRLTYRIPGVEATEVSLGIPAIDTFIEARRVTLRPAALGFGVLRLVLAGGEGLAFGAGHEHNGAGAGDQPRPWEAWTNAAHVEIISKSSDEGYRVSLPALRPGASEIDGIPFGVYRIRLVLNGHGGVYPGAAGATLEIGREPAVLKISLHELGTIRLQPENYDATRRHMGVSVNVAREGRTSWSTYNLSEPPYLVQGLKPGRYNLQLEAWSRGHEKDRASVSAMVLPDQVSEVRFSWER